MVWKCTFTTYKHSDKHTHWTCRQVLKHTDPSQDGEEAKSDGGSCGVGALGQRQLVRRGRLPLIGEETKAHEPQETRQAWRHDREGVRKGNVPNLSNLR